MIETYKILSGKYDTNLVPNLKTTGIQATRGNDLRIFKTRFKYDLRKFYYAALLPRRGPHIASHSVCLSVRLSVRLVIVYIRTSVTCFRQPCGCAVSFVLFTCQGRI